ncbi:MAG: thiamine pyrophosphate-dependent enzyme [Opitutales bacterium]|nr:thiamine pyrophosphate-dependent enzyme [Opitutales bacterium]
MNLQKDVKLTQKLSKKVLTAKQPTWCRGCGDHSILAAYFRLLEKLQLPHENIVTISGIGCSSRFPYFVNSHGIHSLHGRALPFASGVAIARPDLSTFVFSGDGDCFSIGGNHLDHTARKNPDMTYLVMDNTVYGMTKKQTSPTSPKGFVSKTDPFGAVDEPINPMKRLIACGATFVARTSASNISHVMEMLERAHAHPGFAVIECLSECTQFNLGSFEGLNPRKGGAFPVIEEKLNDGSPEDEKRHDPTDEVAAYKLAEADYPGWFGVFIEKKLPTKDDLEQSLIENVRSKNPEWGDREHLQASLNSFA